MVPCQHSCYIKVVYAWRERIIDDLNMINDDGRSQGHKVGKRFQGENPSLFGFTILIKIM